MAQLLPRKTGEMLLPDRDEFDSWDEHFQAEEDAFEGLMEQSRAIDPDDDDITGFMCKWQRADGYAWYRVEGTDPLRLCHVPYMDGYRVEGALIRGLRESDIRDQIESRRKWDEIRENQRGDD